MVKAQRFVYAKRFVGAPKEDDFALVTEELAPIKDGGKFSFILKQCFHLYDTNMIYMQRCLSRPSI